jgi:hypothetical protein
MHPDLLPPKRFRPCRSFNVSAGNHVFRHSDDLPQPHAGGGELMQRGSGRRLRTRSRMRAASAGRLGFRQRAGAGNRPLMRGIK